MSAPSLHIESTDSMIIHTVRFIMNCHITNIYILLIGRKILLLKLNIDLLLEDATEITISVLK